MGCSASAKVFPAPSAGSGLVKKFLVMPSTGACLAAPSASLAANASSMLVSCGGANSCRGACAVKACLTASAPKLSALSGKAVVRPTNCPKSAGVAPCSSFPIIRPFKLLTNSFASGNCKP